jgi:transcriptional regulator with XRE-family HTH domain
MGGIKRKGGKSGELRRLISDARLASDQSVVKIAKKAGLSANYIRLIESGERRPSQDALSRICQALELSADQWRSFFKAAALEPPTNERSGWLGDALRLTSHLKPTALELMASAKYWGIRIPAERTFEKAAEKIQDEGYTTIAPSAIEVMVERIDANGWVEHRVWDDVETGLPARNGQLEAKLLERFNLRHAIVGTLPQFVRTSSEHDDDDLLHHWLGRMAAPALIVTLREGDVIAFGSGRGPFQCAKAVSVRSAQSFPQVKRIAPLCGVIDARDWAGGRPDRMDADDVVRVFRGIVLDREPAPLINAPVLNMVPRRMPAHLQIE